MADLERDAGQQSDTGEVLDTATRAGSGASENASPLEGLLAYVPDGTARPERVPSGLRSAELVELRAPRASVRVRGMTSVISAVIAPEVDGAFLEQARREGQRVLVELEPGHEPTIVGVIQTRLPERVRLEARIVEIEAKESLTLRSG